MELWWDHGAALGIFPRTRRRVLSQLQRRSLSLLLPRRQGTAFGVAPPCLTTVGAERWGKSSQITTGIFAPTLWGCSSVTVVNSFQRLL